VERNTGKKQDGSDKEDLVKMLGETIRIQRQSNNQKQGKLREKEGWVKYK